jgi:hypothetical protein
MAGSDRPRMTRRGFVTTSAMTLGTAAATAGAVGRGASIASAADTTGENRGEASGFVGAVLAAFTKHQVVGIAEGGTHGLQDHFDLLTTLLHDPRLPAVVDDVVVEFGNARYQSTMDQFIAGTRVEDTDLRPVWRNTTQSPLGTWDEPVFEQFYRTVRSVNLSLSSNHRFRVLLGDPPIDWSEVTTQEAFNAFQMQRDSHAATVIQQQTLAKGRRALVCYGSVHLHHTPTSQSAPGMGVISTLERQTGRRAWVLQVLVPWAGDPGGLGQRLSAYPRRSVIPTSGTWLGQFDAGLIFPAVFRGPGTQPTNRMCGVGLGDLIDGGVYLGQPGQLTVSRENPALYLDPGYWAELQRRNAIQGGMVDLDSYRRQQPVQYTAQPFDPAYQCS